MHPLVIGFAVLVTPDRGDGSPSQTVSAVAQRYDELLTAFASALRADAGRAASFHTGSWIQRASEELGSS